METLLECTQEMDKTTRKETKVTFGPEDSVSMEIVDTESSSDTGQEKNSQKMIEYLTAFYNLCFLLSIRLLPTI